MLCMGLALVTKHIMSIPIKGDKSDVVLAVCFMYVCRGVVGASVVKVSRRMCSEKV